MTKPVVVVGGAPPGAFAALLLARCGASTHLVEEGFSLGRNIPVSRNEPYSFDPRLSLYLKLAQEPLATIHTLTKVCEIQGTAGNFRVKTKQRPRYVDENLCSACGRCEEACPVEVNGRKAIFSCGPGALPDLYAVEKQGLPPCREACPAGVNAQGYIALIRAGKYAEALALERERNPLAAVSSRVCDHPCERHCTRTKVGDPVAIRELKRFLADAEEPTLAESPPKKNDAPRVAIVGSGPAGLTAARDLAASGLHVTIFESLPEPGGILLAGIPRFRLPLEVLEKDVRYILSFGVELKTGKTLGKDFTLPDLFLQGYKAVFLAIGAQLGRRLKIPGEDLPGVEEALQFMREVNLQGRTKIGRRVLVIGGGNAALDVSRTALRMGAETVTIVYRRGVEEMPAQGEEIEETLHEGVKMQTLVSPVKFHSRDGKLSGLELIHNELGEPDASGRRRSVPIPGSEFFLEADMIICALGQEVDACGLDEAGLRFSRQGTIEADPVTCATNMPGVFAGGDAVTGAATAIEAIAAGKRAAVSIRQYLLGEEVKGEEKPRWPISEEKLEMLACVAKPSPMIRQATLPIEERVRTFREVALGLSEEQAKKEAERCLNCGVCSDCMECVRACSELEALKHEETERLEEIEASAVIIATDLPEGLPGGEGIVRISEIHDLSHEILREIKEVWVPAEYELRSALQDSFAVLGASAAGSAIFSCGLPSREEQAPYAPLGDDPPRVGVYLCSCGGRNPLPLADLATRSARFDGVVISRVFSYLCSQAGVEALAGMVLAHRLNRLVLGACACCESYQACEGCIHQRVRLKVRLKERLGRIPVVLEFLNLREQWGWVHPGDGHLTIDGAEALIRMAVCKSSKIRILPRMPYSLCREVLVISSSHLGAKIAGVLTSSGFVTFLAGRHAIPSGVRYLGDFGSFLIAGYPGCYEVTLSGGGLTQRIRCGAIIGEGVRHADAGGSKVQSCLEGIFDLPPSQDMPNEEEQMISFALLALISSLFSRRSREAPSGLVSVEAEKCRDCGNCVLACPQSIPGRIEGPDGSGVSSIAPELCLGCGICFSRCNTGALRSFSPFRSEPEPVLRSLIQ